MNELRFFVLTSSLEGMQSSEHLFRLYTKWRWSPFFEFVEKEDSFMLKNGFHVLWMLIGFALIVPQMPVFAGEHHSVKASFDAETKVKQATQDYINAQIKDKGSFEVADKVSGKTRKLKFDYFHTINKLDN